MRIYLQILNFLHRGPVTFSTLVYDTNVGDISALATYFNPDRISERELNLRLVRILCCCVFVLYIIGLAITLQVVKNMRPPRKVDLIPSSSLDCFYIQTTI